MNYLHYKVDAGPDQMIAVSLSDRANVRLLDSLNYYKYRAGKKYEMTDGGEALDPPVTMKAPYKASWHVVIDLGGQGGEVTADVRVVKV
jgi:hypothetical protein